MENIKKKGEHYLKYKICVSGAAVTDHCPPDALKATELIGREIVRHNGIVVTGATTGMPYWAAKGAKKEGGVSIGISPAASEIAHIKKYRLPIDYFDLIIYTGFNYAGRNLLLTRSADAVIITCGRMGTLNEFTIAFEDNKPIGILDLKGHDGTVELIREIVKTARRGPGKIVYDSNPKKLIEKLLPLIDEDKEVAMPKK